MVKKILSVRDPSLRQKSKPVKQADKKLAKLFTDLENTLKKQKDPEGVGLSAPQINEFWRVFIINHGKKTLRFVNPVITKKSKKTNDPPKTKSKKEEQDYVMEGCLSLPNYYGPVRRSWWIDLEYQTSKMENRHKRFSGFLAQVIQHETDHLDGVLFVDRLLGQRRNLFRAHGEHWHEVELLA